MTQGEYDALRSRRWEIWDVETRWYWFPIVWFQYRLNTDDWDVLLNGLPVSRTMWPKMKRWPSRKSSVVTNIVAVNEGVTGRKSPVVTKTGRKQRGDLTVTNKIMVNLSQMLERSVDATYATGNERIYLFTLEIKRCHLSFTTVSHIV